MQILPVWLTLRLAKNTLTRVCLDSPVTWYQTRDAFTVTKNPHKMVLKACDEYSKLSSFQVNFVGVMAEVSMIREATVVIFNETGVWPLPKWIWVINKSIKMFLSYKHYSVTNFLWRTWFRKSARSKTLRLVPSSWCSWARRENLENSR